MANEYYLHVAKLLKLYCTTSLPCSRLVTYVASLWQEQGSELPKPHSPTELPWLTPFKIPLSRELNHIYIQMHVPEENYHRTSLSATYVGQNQNDLGYQLVHGVLRARLYDVLLIAIAVVRDTMPASLYQLTLEVLKK